MSESRRTFLKTAGASVVGVAVAGCTGNSSDGSDGTTEATTTADGTDTVAENETTTGESSTTASAGDVSGSVGSESNADLELTEHSYFQDGSNEGVRGTVTNTSDKTYSLVVVHVNPENDEAETLDRFEVDSSESIDTLEPDATWDFEVVFDGDIDFTQYTIWATGQTEGNSGETSNATTNETAMNETTTAN
ncbi:Tat (twin-arginine translocation) pathway signal sequence [Halogranum rubrum]|uniref:Tat (Twin-arginine translocation) pathway signal sequence n=1 Tax=Halogranum rubrum TaxID=553466 RepID=A0A1I4GH85_9EURY|nr:FxLYD domain-containing protein [Halogranum rubrum]SFL28551.1 Tat (twin-arginine translocation) pathway signal sequence [Halogranum rubrum]